MALAFLIFAINIVVNRWFLLPGDTFYRDSIEPGYASMARIVAQNPNPYGWNPYQYSGLPMHLWYLPVMPYGGAFLIKLLPFLGPEHVYRMMATTLACLTPVALFALLALFTRNRKWAFAGAVFFSLASVCYLAFPAIDTDRGAVWVPWRIQVLVKYGEGPHNAGLTLMVLALIACWRAATGRRYRDIFVAAVALAAVCLTNWIAALATAWCVLMMLLAGAGTACENGFLGRRIVAAGSLGYLLACFWLTPDFIVTTLFNWPTDAFGYKVQTTQRVLLAGLLILPFLIRWIAGRFTRDFFLCWLALSLFGFAWVVSIHYWFRIDTVPESRRYALEVELFFWALIAAAGQRLAASGVRWKRDAAIAVVSAVAGLAFANTREYVTEGWLAKPLNQANSPEYAVSSFLDAAKPEGRVFVSGGTRFRLQAWFTIPQLGGTFESGLRNRGPLYGIYHVRTGYGGQPDRRGLDSVNLLRAWGVQYAAVHGPTSKEHWKDIANPEMFESIAEKAWSSGGDAIYRIPFTSLAHLVRPEELPVRFPVGYDVRLVEPYVAAMDDPARPRLTVTWDRPSKLTIRGAVADGHRVALRVSYDEGWRAEQDGEAIGVGSDVMGHIVLDARPKASSTITLRYRPLWTHFLFSVISAVAWAAALVALWKRRHS